MPTAEQRLMGQILRITYTYKLRGATAADAKHAVEMVVDLILHWVEIRKGGE